MKYIFLSIILSVILVNSTAQNCEIRSGICSHDPNIVKTGSNASVVFKVDDTSLPTDYAYKVYYWDFGDGSAGTSQTVYPGGYYQGETHLYNLSNTAIVKNGILEVTAKYVVMVYVDKSNTQSGYDISCYTKDELITWTIPSFDLFISLKADPDYDKYPLNKPYTLVYNISTTNYSATDNLTYKLSRNGTDISFGNVSIDNLNKNVTLLTDTPKQAGTYRYDYTLSRYGATVGTSPTFSITVDSDTTKGSSTGTGTCLCTDLRPDFKLTYVKYSRSGDSIIIQDNSSSEFKRVYGGCTKYGLQVLFSTAGGAGVLQELTDYKSSGFRISMSVRRPDIYEQPLVCTFYMVYECLKSGQKLSVEVEKKITVPPDVFSPSENTVNVSPNGGWVYVTTHSNSCLSMIKYNPLNPIDELNWLQDNSGFGGLRLKVDTNYTKSIREVRFILFMDAHADKSLDVVNGEKKCYRTVNFYQPTKIPFSDYDTLSSSNIFIPFINAPVGTDYYIVNTDYLRNINYGIPVNYLISKNNIVTIGFKDQNGKHIGQQTFTFYNSLCCLWSTKEVIDWMANYDITVVNNWKPILNLNDSIKIATGKMLSLFNMNEINLSDGFEVNEGSFFEAAIKECGIPKSLRAPDASETAKKDSITSFENIIVYPNPSPGTLFIENKSPDIPMILAQIIDGQGRIIKIIEHLSNLQKITMDKNPSGLYVLRVFTSKGVCIRKFVLNEQ